MQAFITKIGVQIADQDGEGLGRILQPLGKEVTLLVQKLGNSDRKFLEKYKGGMAAPWDEVVIALVQVNVHMLDDNHAVAYQEQAHLVNQFFRFMLNQTAWILPALLGLLRTLRQLAAKASRKTADAAARKEGTKSDALEDAARICNKAFTNCLTDRSALYTRNMRTSRKWGVYALVGMTLKCYIAADRMGLHKSLLRSLTVQKDMPPFEDYPKADQVTCKYYFGLLAFLSEDWSLAFDEFSAAFAKCGRGSDPSIVRNQERILTYLVPLQLMRGRLPPRSLIPWDLPSSATSSDPDTKPSSLRYPNLAALYTPFIRALRAGDLRLFDLALVRAEPRLVQKNVWGLMESRVREVCLRGFFVRVWKTLSADSKKRMPVGIVRRGLKLVGGIDELDEAECITAGLIFRGFIKGYISHEKRMVVLAAKDPFPSLSSVAVKA
ncbi:hypothetical protein DL93DRAFT_2054813 [Clavulina sp. PMI_390]|nr:hypothetical protein DL93DRAFT_2054813 [Clavulina sp. PMI_390]